MLPVITGLMRGEHAPRDHWPRDLSGPFLREQLQELQVQINML